MIAEPDLAPYLEELRRDVCVSCPERLPGGPPCAPLGKECGIELHLRDLVDSVRGVQSEEIEPYQQALQQEVCAHCSWQGGEGCPCPMYYLAVLVVQAIEDAGESLEQKERVLHQLPRPVACPRAPIARMQSDYEEETGDRIGCD
jgi:hypothetical protein